MRLHVWWLVIICSVLFTLAFLTLDNDWQRVYIIGSRKKKEGKEIKELTREEQKRFEEELLRNAPKLTSEQLKEQEITQKMMEEEARVQLRAYDREAKGRAAGHKFLSERELEEMKPYPDPWDEDYDGICV